MKLTKKAKLIIKKKCIEMPKCWCGSIKPNKYRINGDNILFYCNNHI